MFSDLGPKKSCYLLDKNFVFVKYYDEQIC